MGSGGPSIENVILAADKTRAKTPKLMGPFIVPRTMASTASATLAVPFKIKGVNYTMSSACATSGHCIGNSVELIQSGKQKIMFSGGSEELHWAMTAMFDAMTALSSKYNDTPEKASRAYDKTRDGFVIAGGGGVKNMSMQKQGVLKFMQRSQVMEQHQTDMIWWHLLEKEQLDVCKWH